MKKIIFVGVSILAFFIMGYNYITDSTGIPFVEHNEAKYREGYNSEVNIRLARKIKDMAETEKVAIIGNEKYILVGVSLKPSVSGRNEIKKNVENMVKTAYKNAEIQVEIETETMKEIFELTDYAGQGASDKMLISKMKQLQKNSNDR